MGRKLDQFIGTVHMKLKREDSSTKLAFRRAGMEIYLRLGACLRESMYARWCELMVETVLSGLVGHCGLYCNACGIRQGKIKTAVDNLRDIIAHYGFDKLMPQLSEWEQSFKYYDEFSQVMDGLVTMFGGCPGCLQGGGDPNCKVRGCTEQKGYRTCAECDEIENCEKLAPYREGYRLVPALESIKQKGIAGYAEEMQRRVDEGYSYT